MSSISNALQIWSEWVLRPESLGAFIMISRRYADSAMSIWQRLATGFIGIIPAALLSGIAAMGGVYISMERTIAELESQDRVMSVMMDERKALYEEKLHTCTENFMLLGVKMSEMDAKLQQMKHDLDVHSSNEPRNVRK